MKTKIIIYLVVIQVLVLINYSFASDVSKKNIIYYYQKLSIKELGGYKFPLKFVNKKWVTYSSADYELYPVVDTKNGYIYIEDEGTGGGTIFHEIVLYRKKDKSAILAVNVHEFGGIEPNTIQFGFYKYENSLYNNISSKVFPEIKIENYLKNKNDLNEIKKIRSELIKFEKNRKVKILNQFLYKLPRYGSEIKIKLNKKFIIWNLEVFKKEISQKNIKKIKTVLENLKYNTLICKWNKNKGKFYIFKGQK